jgi:hypothetical protein
MSYLAPLGPEIEKFLQAVMPKNAFFFFQILNACHKTKKIQAVEI